MAAVESARNHDLAAAPCARAADTDPSTLHVETFELTAPAEVKAVSPCVARLRLRHRGREAAVSRDLDGRESQDIVLVRGPVSAEYPIALGPATPGRHRVSITLDRDAKAPVTHDVTLDGVRLVVIPEGDPAYLAAAYAPMLYARPDAFDRFSDVPLILGTRSIRCGRKRSVLPCSATRTGALRDRVATWGRRPT